uniref:Uncharacterized protein n=2 Tax=Spongospora subterranea TaxID=70186 RepID=A0A0H5REI2_9EUKA|eukprot:CRZ06984.1 hypothetical protein [Spongospora subterranea]
MSILALFELYFSLVTEDDFSPPLTTVMSMRLMSSGNISRCVFLQPRLLLTSPYHVALLRLFMPGPMGNSEIVVYDVDTFSQHQRIDLKDCGCHFVVFHPNGQEILIATTAHDLLRYDQCTRQLLGETRQSKDVAKPITLLRLSPCGNFVVTVDNVNLVRVLQYNSIGNNSCYGQAQEFRMEGPVTAIEFASSDRIVFSVGNAIRMWRFQQDRSDTGEDGRPTPSSFEHVAVVGSPSTFEVATNSRSITHLQPTSPPRRRISQLVTDASKSNVGYTSKYHACYSAPSRVRPAPTVYLVPEETAAVSLQQIVGFNGNGRHNAIWIEDSGQLIFTHGRTIIVEVLFESRQHFLLAHSMEISTLAVSNDLTTLASADGAVNDIGHRASIFLWALDGLTAVSEIATRHANGIQSLAFNCTGEFLLSVGQGPDGILAIWDVATGSCVAAQDHVQQIVMGALWTPLSTDYFITISDHSVELWGMHPSDSQAKSTYSLSRSLLPMTDFKLGNQTSSGGFTAVAFIAKEYLIVGTHVGSVHIWRVHEWSYIGEVALVTFEISSLFGVQGLVTGNRDSTSLMLITAGASDSVHRWTVELSSTPNSKMLVSATGLLRMGTDNCKVASCSWDTLGHVGIVGLDNGNILYANWYSDSEPECQPGIATSVNDDERYPAMAKLITSHTSQILQLRFSPSSEEFASSCCVDGTVRLWNNISSFNDGGHGQCRYRQIMLYQVPNQTCNCICFSSSGVALASGWSDGCVRILNLLQFSVSNKIELGHPVDHLVYSCSGARLFAAANNGVVYVIDGATFELKFQINNHEQCQIDMLDCSQADDSLVLDCDQRARVSIWSTSRIDPNNGYHTSLIKWIAIQDLNAIHNPFFAANDSLNRIKNLAVFDRTSPEIIIWCIPSCMPQISIYNFLTNQTLRVLPIPHSPLCMMLSKTADFVVLGTIGIIFFKRICIDRRILLRIGQNIAC